MGLAVGGQRFAERRFYGAIRGKSKKKNGKKRRFSGISFTVIYRNCGFLI
jgi:hypothetical protein